MNLTLFFIILSLILGFLLYDSLKKSRQKANKTSQTVSNRLKINYTRECTILNNLNKQKSFGIKNKTISIHLQGHSSQLTQQQAIKIKQIITKTNNYTYIYLLEKQNYTPNHLHNIIKDIVGATFVIPYNSIEGAVAILRQLSCGIHLQSQSQLYTKIRQYISKIWFVGVDPNQQALRQFKTQKQMIEMLQNLQGQDKIKL